MCKKKILIIEDGKQEYLSLAKFINTQEDYEVIPRYVNDVDNDYQDVTHAFGWRELEESKRKDKGIKQYTARIIRENYSDLKLIICDLDFLKGTGTQGKDVIKYIKQEFNDSKIGEEYIQLLPIIAYTRFETLAQGALDNGASFWLPKPTDKEKNNNVFPFFKETITQQIRYFDKALRYFEESIIPMAIREKVKKFKEDHKDKRTAFIMSSFSEDKHKPIIEKIKTILTYHNIEGIVADNTNLYAKNVNDQLSIHLHGCDFGIGVLTNLDTADIMTEELRKRYGFNPNLLIECGYMYGLDKDVCLLKESNAANPPSDWQGLIWKPFNNNDLNSLEKTLEEWLRSFGYIK